MSCRLTGKSSRFGREDSWFEPRRDNKHYRVDKLAKSPRFERGVWGFEALPGSQKQESVLQSSGVDAALSRRRSWVRIPSGPRKVAVWRRKPLLGKEKNIPITVLSSNGRITRCLRDGCGFEPRQDREITRCSSVW